MVKNTESGDKKTCCSVAKLCPTLSQAQDCSLPGSSVLGILQAWIPEWVAISSGRSSSPRGWTYILHWQADSLPLSHQGSPPEDRRRMQTIKRQDAGGRDKQILMRDPESTNHKRKYTAQFEFIKISFSSSKDIMRVWGKLQPGGWYLQYKYPRGS